MTRRGTSLGLLDERRRRNLREGFAAPAAGRLEFEQRVMSKWLY